MPVLLARTHAFTLRVYRECSLCKQQKKVPWECREHPGLGSSALAEAKGTPCGICLVVGSCGHEDNPQMLSYKSG